MGPRDLTKPLRASAAHRTAPRRLTAASIAALKPRASRYEITDPACEGLQLRIEPSGFKSWILRYYWHGKRVRLVLGQADRTSLARAREIASECRRSLDRQIDPRRAGIVGRATKATPLQFAPHDKHSVRHLADEFLRLHVKPRSKAPDYVARILNVDVIPKWGDRDARSIKPADVIELLDGIVERGSTVMANRVAAVLGQLFKFGIHRTIVESTPVQLLYRPGGRERPRERSLTDQELATLLTIVPSQRWERLHRAINILLLTGQRRSELGLARRADLDLAARTWRIPDSVSKTGRGHVVPLSDWAVDEFRGLIREAEGSKWLFPSSDDDDSAPADPKLLTRNLARAFDRSRGTGKKGRRPSAIKGANDIAPFTLHDLRRTCRTGLARLKIAPHIAERVLNHAQERIPGTYDVHDYLDEKRDALERWAAHLRTLDGRRRENAAP